MTRKICTSLLVCFFICGCGEEAPPNSASQAAPTVAPPSEPLSKAPESSKSAPAKAKASKPTKQVGKSKKTPPKSVTQPVKSETQVAKSTPKKPAPKEAPVVTAPAPKKQPPATPKATSAKGESGFVIKPCDVMDKPFRDAKSVASLKKDDVVEIFEKKGGWLRVGTGKNEGWVRMFNIRRGKAKAGLTAGTEAKGVLNLASGRAGTGNVVSATGVRGLSEEELKEAEFNPEQLKKLESFTVSKEKAKSFAKKGELAPKSVEFLE